MPALHACSFHGHLLARGQRVSFARCRGGAPPSQVLIVAASFVKPLLLLGAQKRTQALGACTRLSMCSRMVSCHLSRYTPLIVGPSNTGKSTLLLPLDDLFGKKHVFHKPALRSKFALRNIMRDKRFLFWDDYRPVEYAQSTVEVSTLLSLFTGHPFEVQVSQSFNDGNPDFECRQS